MKFSSTLLGAGLLATTAIAAPLSSSSKVPARRVNHKLGRTSRPNFVNHGHGKGNVTILAEGDPTGSSNTDYSTNWAGAVYKSPPVSDGATFNSVSASITVPSPSLPPNAAAGQDYSSSAWVGIDGDTYGGAILQTGINMNVDSNGNPSFSSWYEWYPLGAYNFDNEFQINVGDVLTFDIVATSTTTGTATITRQSDGAQVSQDLTAPSGSTLGGINCEAISEDYSISSGLVPLANFGSVTYTNMVCGLTDGTSIGPGAASVIELEDSNGNVIVTASVDANNVYTNYASS